MGQPHVKPSTLSEPTNLKELANGPKHVSFADETASQCQLSWLGLAHNVSGRLSLLSDRLSGVTSLSWRSDRSQASVRSAGRPWSRVSRKRWSQTTLENPLLGCKTAWPVGLAESLFLPEFPIRQRSRHTCYQIVKTLGSGAFGKVYQIKLDEMERPFALKVLSKSHVVYEGAIGQVKDEVSIQTACGHHPYVVSCPDRWQTRKQLFVLQELVAGGELRDLWMRHGSLHEELVQLYVAELACALDFLHNAGVIFRDLKLENVLLDDLMNVKLIDFGLAKWLRHGSRTRTLCGTLQYMAPEVLDMQPYTHSVDWWSLGVVAFCLLSGNYPVAAERDHLQMRQSVFASPFRLPCHVSAPARSLVARLLTPEPRHRLNSTLKLAREAWFAKYDLDAVRAREVSARLIYDKYYPAVDTTSESGHHSDNFIDFDATTVDESLGSWELVEEFPSMQDGSPLGAAAAVSTPCRSAGEPPPPSADSTDSLVASSGVLSPHRKFATTESCLPTGTPQRATIDTFDETSSGDILELHLPQPPSDGEPCSCEASRGVVGEVEQPPELNCHGARTPSTGDDWTEAGRACCALRPPPADESLKRPGSADVCLDRLQPIWKRPRTAKTDSGGEDSSGAADPPADM